MASNGQAVTARGQADDAASHGCHSARYPIRPPLYVHVASPRNGPASLGNDIARHLHYG
jgi:hypothetical protein